MPFYEYRCEACGHDFEAMQKIEETIKQDNTRPPCRLVS